MSGAKVIALLLVNLAFFLLAGYWEWQYYSADQQHSAARSRLHEEQGGVQDGQLSTAELLHMSGQSPIRLSSHNS